MDDELEKESKGIDLDNEYCVVLSSKTTSSQFRAFLNNDIAGPCMYNKLIHVLYSANEDDDVNIHINSGGGNVMTAFQILGAIMQSKANVSLYLEGEVGSAASMIAVGSPCAVYVSPFVSMLCHAYSSVQEGKRHELKAAVDFYHDFLGQKMIEIYKGFLSDSEIQEMLNGKDFMFDSEEITMRFAKRGIKEYKNAEEATACALEGV
jgi:ATP-dependent protease ClpP protease subunit